MEYVKNTSTGNVYSSQVQKFVSDSMELGRKTSPVTSSFPSSPDDLTSEKARVLEVEYSQSEAHDQKVPHRSALFNHSSRGVESVPKIDIGKESQLSTADSTNHPLHLEKEDYQSTSDREHPDEVVLSRETRLLLKIFRKLFTNFGRRSIR